LAHASHASDSVSRGGFDVQKHGPELDIDGKYAHWVKASPWLFGANPRDLIMPVDGDDGFYPTGNELVLFCIVYLLNLALMY